MDINCIVDIASREVSFQENYRIAAYDHNVDVIHFSVEPIEDFSLDTSSIKIAAQGPNNVRHDYAVDPSTVAIEEETGYITFDWPIPAGVTEMPIGTFKHGDKGRLIFAVCAEIISGSTVSKAWHSDDGIITVVAHLEPEAGGGEDPSETATNAQKIAQLQTSVTVLGTQVGALGNGSPTPVATVAEMTDESAVYLYTGSETGYTAGNWYYYNGTAWTSGGTYGGAVIDTTLSIQGRAADAKKTGDEISELKEDLTSNIAEVTGKMQKVASANLLDTDNILVDHSCNIYGVTTESAGYKCTNNTIPVAEGDVLRFYYLFRGNVVLNDMRFVTAYNASGVVVSASSAQSVSSYTVPSGISGVKITFPKNSDLPPMLTKNYEASEYEEYYAPYYIATNDFVPNAIAEIDSIKVARSGNVLNTATLQSGYSITASGGLVENSGYATTDFIEVKEGDVVVASFNTSNVMTIARLVTYKQDKSVIDGSTASVTSYTVPSGVSYIRFCAINAYMTLSTARINLDGTRHPFESYYSGDVNAIAQKNGTDIFNVLNYPLTSLPEYILKNLCYKPLGTLSKGYICIVSDDGNEAVASYTIPMFIEKNVPFTLAMMQASPVLATQSGIATVKDAVDNHGCCVAQHGGFTTPYWNTMDEYVLNDFFNSEAEYWSSIGITPHGACAPGHQVNDMVRALAGGRFGCHRAAYFDGAPWYGDTYYINGPRSNMYSLTSQNIAEGDLNYWKAKCDMTLAQKWLMMIHLHENEMDASDKSQLESVIDYAKSIGLTFITMADIPTII